jgi:hypothetical protein
VNNFPVDETVFRREVPDFFSNSKPISSRGIAKFAATATMRVSPAVAKDTKMRRIKTKQKTALTSGPLPQHRL